MTGEGLAGGNNNPILLDSWKNFETEVSRIFEAFEGVRKGHPGFIIFPPLFRGHAQRCWTLKTTLERYLNKDEYSIKDYYNILRKINPVVESLTSKSWGLEDNPKFDIFSPPPGYEFMVYLRHHGFPTPLLDWTISPYVAAFFAFQDPQNEDGQNEDKYIAIYHYGNYEPGEGECLPIIYRLGPSIRTHKRHFIQQCWYTICVKKGVNEGDLIYCNHEGAYRNAIMHEGNILTKYLIPRSERSTVLNKLNFMNINAFSLFANEESLMATLAYQIFTNGLFGIKEM